MLWTDTSVSISGSFHIHTCLWNSTLSDQDHWALWVTSPFASNGFKTPPAIIKKQTKKKPQCNHKLLYTKYTETQNLYLLVPKELYEKIPQRNTKSCKQQQFSFGFKTSTIFFGYLLWIEMANFVRKILSTIIDLQMHGALL